LLWKGKKETELSLYDIEVKVIEYKTFTQFFWVGGVFLTFQEGFTPLSPLPLKKEFHLFSFM
jgi:hypothetical protein